MSESCENQAHICRFPTELIALILKKLPMRDIIKCRQVCRRWKDVADFMIMDDNLWKQHCLKEFKDLAIAAMKKSKPCTPWFHLYRSLSLWSHLDTSSEYLDEFCHSSVSVDEIQDLSVLPNSVLAVHKRSSIVYYDLNTYEMIERNPLYGEFTRWVENDDTLIILTSQLHLRIIKKSEPIGDMGHRFDLEDGEEVVFHYIKRFLVVDRDVYFVNLNNSIFCCNIDGNWMGDQLPEEVIGNVMGLSFHNGHLNVLTHLRNIYEYRDKKFNVLFNLESKKGNLIDCLWQYGFLEALDWRMFYIWAALLRVRIPEGPLRYICMVKVYGDCFFIGCKNGILLIYYKPYTNGQLDFFSHQPVKKYYFAERADIPVLSLQPILSIDVMEIEEGHQILAATPKKVIILTYRHSFENVKSKAVIPYIPPRPMGNTV